MIIYIVIVILVSIWLIYYRYFFLMEGFYTSKPYVIYCINMDTSIDRWSNILHYNKTYNLDIERFSAYNGKTLNLHSFIQNGYLSIYNTLEKGQIGCALSHVFLWEKCRESHKSYFILLEDDVIIPANFTKTLECILEHAPDGWDIVYLGGCYVKGSLVNGQFIKPTAYESGFNLCTHAYILNKQSIPKMLDIMKPIQLPIDNQLRNHFSKLNVYFYYKNIVKQNNTFNTTVADKKRLKYHTMYHNNSNNIVIV